MALNVTFAEHGFSIALNLVATGNRFSYQEVLDVGDDLQIEYLEEDTIPYDNIYNHGILLIGGFCRLFYPESTSFPSPAMHRIYQDIAVTIHNYTNPVPLYWWCRNNRYPQEIAEGDAPYGPPVAFDFGLAWFIYE